MSTCCQTLKLQAMRNALKSGAKMQQPPANLSVSGLDSRNLNGMVANLSWIATDPQHRDDIQHDLRRGARGSMTKSFFATLNFLIATYYYPALRLADVGEEITVAGMKINVDTSYALYHKGLEACFRVPFSVFTRPVYKDDGDKLIKDMRKAVQLIYTGVVRFSNKPLDSLMLGLKSVQVRGSDASLASIMRTISA